MQGLTIETLLNITGGLYFGPYADMAQEIVSITTDSRTAVKGCLFAAIKGERVDGHDYIQACFEKGAACVIAERYPEEMYGPVIIVESTLSALQQIAKYYLASLNIPVVGITGSVGKTSTKEMIASVLSTKYRVCKTEGNFNNGLGLPLTIFRLRKEDEIAVLEMGISDFGEMHLLADIARPDVCVMTNIGYAHLEQLKDRDGILKAKSEIFDFLDENGTIIVNGDDDKLMGLEKVKGISPIRYGIRSDNAVYADQIEADGIEGSHCTMHTPEGEISLFVPMPGEYMIYNALAGAAVGRRFGLSLQEMKQGIEAYRSISGRFHVIHAGSLTVIDDCYNANPASMKASLKVLGQGAGRKVAILGDMGELGTEAVALHREVGSFAALESKADLLITVGELSEHISKAAEEAKPASKQGQEADGSKSKADSALPECIHFQTITQLCTQLEDLLKAEDIILVKASHFMHFEQIVKKIQDEIRR